MSADSVSAATERPDLQLRMQGNSFLGAFFKVSSFLQDHEIGEEEYEKLIAAMAEGAKLDAARPDDVPDPTLEENLEKLRSLGYIQ